MNSTDYCNFKSSFPFYFKKKINSEIFRFSVGIDTEISDNLMFKYPFFKIYNELKRKKYCFSGINSIKGKSDLLSLIDPLEKGILVQSLLKSYSSIKKDLIDIVKYKDKNRILIMINGRNVRDLTIYSFKSQYLIKNCDSLIIPWYKTFV